MPNEELYAVGRFLLDCVARSENGYVRIYEGPRRGERSGRGRIFPQPTHWHVTVRLNGHDHTVSDDGLSEALSLAVTLLIERGKPRKS